MLLSLAVDAAVALSRGHDKITAVIQCMY